MVSYLASIPLDLEEAALVDGATRMQALLRVIVPLALPGIVVALVFSFLTGWNDVLFASVLTSPTTRTLAVELQVFSTAQEGGGLPLYGQLMSAAAVSAPLLPLAHLAFLGIGAGLPEMVALFLLVLAAAFWPLARCERAPRWALVVPAVLLVMAGANAVHVRTDPIAPTIPAYSLDK